MAERVASSDTTATPAAPDRPGSLKHCWVLDGEGRLPGLLLEWRRGERGFEGRVVHAVDDPQLGWIVVEEWVSAERLGPA
jgi:hypothetical protein